MDIITLQKQKVSPELKFLSFCYQHEKIKEGKRYKIDQSDME